MRKGALVALLLAAGGCATQAVQAPLPVLLRFLPPERGGPTAYPEASPSGVVDLSGPCVRLQLAPGRATTLISSPEASVGRDARGPYLQYRDRRFRHGARVKGGGGHLDQLPAEPLDGPVPEACGNGPFLIFYDPKPFHPSNEPPPSPPPPGPVLIRYKPQQAGGPDVFRAAIVGGTLDFSGQCVRLLGPSGVRRIVVTSSGSRLDWDENGPFLPSGKDRIRHGDEVQAGGGEIGGRLLPNEIDGDIPTGCEDGPFIEAIGIARSRPGSGPAEPPPPPPPSRQ